MWEQSPSSAYTESSFSFFQILSCSRWALLASAQSSSSTGRGKGRNTPPPHTHSLFHKPVFSSGIMPGKSFHSRSLLGPSFKSTKYKSTTSFLRRFCSLRGHPLIPCPSAWAPETCYSHSTFKGVLSTFTAPCPPVFLRHTREPSPSRGGAGSPTKFGKHFEKNRSWSKLKTLILKRKKVLFIKPRRSSFLLLTYRNLMFCRIPSPSGKALLSSSIPKNLSSFQLQKYFSGSRHSTTWASASSSVKGVTTTTS